MKSLVELAIIRRDAEPRVESPPKKFKHRVRWVRVHRYFRCGRYHTLRKVTRFMRIEEKVCDPST